MSEQTMQKPHTPEPALTALSAMALARANLSGRPLRTVLLVVIVAVFSLLLFTGAMMAAIGKRVSRLSLLV